MSTGCGAGQQIPDVKEQDKLVLIEQGNYYGHPNPIRASVDNDPRQCVWRSIQEDSDNDYEAPLLSVPSSMDGIIEWTSNHFFGQLRGNLILSKYAGQLYRVILEPDGRSVIPQSDPALNLGVGSSGLDVTQAPSGTLIEARFDKNNLHYHKPTEPGFSEMRINSVFPRRGPISGGTLLKVYGANFGTGTPQVSVGNSDCPVVSSSNDIIQCTLPSGVGSVDISVTNDSETYVFAKSYRFITGAPGGIVSDTTDPPTAVPTESPTFAATTAGPTASPTVPPATLPPTSAPTPAPTPTPTSSPTVGATPPPTNGATSPPTAGETPAPTTQITTANPTASPTIDVTSGPTSSPTDSSPGTDAPTTASPTLEPTVSPTNSPTQSPVVLVTPVPTTSPTTLSPTASPTQPPVDTPQPGAVKLTLIHAPTNTELVDLQDGAVIDIASLGISPQFNVKAGNAGNTVQSVTFVETAKNEGVEPFAYCGDDGGKYNECPSLGIGTNTVSVIPYPQGGQSGTPFPTVSVTFDIIDSSAPVSTGIWVETNGNATISKRHENCFAMVGRKAYLVGGRGIKPVDIYDPVTRTWSTGAPTPIELHHMQCVAAQGKLWVMAAWTGGFPRESNVDFVYVYDPQLDQWETRTALPLARRRGSSAVVVSEDETKIYVSHGNSGGHETADHAESFGLLDEYTIATDSWRALSDTAPHPRDHCGGALIDGRICVGGGRNGGEVNWPGIAPTDCYDLTTGLWSVEADIPNVRGGSAYGTTCDGKLMVAGGEGDNRAWNEVDVFDGSSWQTINDMAVARHGTQLAVDCTCDQIYVASGAGTAGGSEEIKSVETYFPDGVDVPCLA